MSVVNNLRVSTISPTLRVVLTNECNGKCFFCHREGCLFSKESPLIMNTKMIEEIASTINEIGLSKVIFTGGEPTLYDGLLKAVYIISESCSDVQMEMTSNGYNIEQILDVQEYLHKITISISSLNEDIFMKYTMVNPYTVIDKLSPLKHLKKAISVVITKENILEIDNIINLFSQNDYDIKLQFVISERQDEQEWEREILHKLFQTYGMFEMKLGSTPMLYRKLDSGSKMKIKLYSLNQWMYDNIFVRQNCLSCPYKKKCTERGCSIRVFPNGWVTPCLNNYKVFNGDSVKRIYWMHINLSCYKNILIFVEYLIYNKKYFINTYLMYGLYYWKSRDLKFILSLLFQFKLFIEEIRQIYFCPIYYGIKCFFAMDWLLLLGYHDYIFIRCLSFPFRKELIQHLQTAF